MIQQTRKGLRDGKWKIVEVIQQILSQLKLYKKFLNCNPKPFILY
jgi:hypothetical protein